MISIYWRSLEECISAAIVFSSCVANYLTAPGFLFILASDSHPPRRSCRKDQALSTSELPQSKYSYTWWLAQGKEWQTSRQVLCSESKTPSLSNVSSETAVRLFENADIRDVHSGTT